MAIASTAEARTRLTSFRDVPASKRPRPSTRERRVRLRKMRRRAVIVLLALMSTVTLWFSMATPSFALEDDIKAICGPFDVPSPQARGSGLESFLGTDQVDRSVKASELETYVPKADEWPYKGPKPSYHRYGMAGLEWNAFGWTPGCFSMNRWALFLPNGIFNLSKIFALFTMALVGWSFGKDPFSFLQEPIANVAEAMSNIAAPFLGLVGALGGIYLGMKNLGPNGRVTAVLKGFGWMLLIAGLFFWFQANPVAAGSKINSLVGSVTATGYQSLAKLPSTGRADTSLCNEDSQAEAASCVQDALWTPLVYTPWLYGQVGNSQADTDKWGPAMLNAQFVGVTADGKLDAKGVEVISQIANWNGTSNEVGSDSKSGNMAWDKKYVDKVPFLKLWGNDLCHENDQHNFRMCFGGKDSKNLQWLRGSDERHVKPADEAVLRMASGNDFTARLSASAMSVLGGIIINSSVYFICAMLLAAKLGVFTLMIFAPFYLLLGIFPGPSRVAAIALGELFLINVFRQCGWGLGLVIVTYMDTMILAPGGDHGWLLKILTCALMTVLLGVYAKPAMRALSGMAMGDKQAGHQIVGVGANLAKQTAQLAGQAGLAIATGGASAVAGASGAAAAASASGQTLSAGARMKAAGQGLLKNAPNLGKRTRAGLGKLSDAKDAGKSGYEEGQEREERRASTDLLSRSTAAREGLQRRRQQRAQQPGHEAAVSAIAHRRSMGDTAGADAMEREHFDALRDPRTGIRHQDDPQHPNNLRRSATGGIDEARRVRPAERGEDLLSRNQLTPQQASGNLDRVLAMYDNNPANIDRSHAAGEALWRLSGQVNSGSLYTDVERRAASEAVASHGVPDRIDAVGRAANVQVSVDVFQRVAHELPPQPTSQTATADGRLQLLQRVDAIAAEIPVATALSSALNDLRGVLGNAEATTQQVQYALTNVQQAAGAPVPSQPNTSSGGTP
ncbi:hypothetical protein OG562_23140 [Streptomyces sp. NBC_01275]|uniref:hypothetical protein n=1 Tax=Streptomyces sp. NBC_01275 TaxID=2903807 RepID=UPI002255EC78|nr:hypothetical protein [Streptomyces sp. NBC_01275]MCX4763809.1 hypothetical protein [Streptomyces sp. NBC_01275]